ncbi:MAG: kanamycin kinase [Pseudonocardiales bacterium]|nr:kanamycin kinase [Pseudonocardiales bacterium]
MFSAGPPPSDLPLPPVLERLAGDQAVRPVWRNELGGLTFALGADKYVKWSPSGGPDLTAERARLSWAGRFTPVPHVIDYGSDEGAQWLMTTALPGDTAVSDSWLDDPEPAVVAIGRGLRALHDALPVGECPFDWSAPRRVARARRKGRRDPADWWPDHQHLDPDDAFARLDDVPPVDRVVVCHGDPCSPNTILDSDGGWVGHVDIGAMGVADRWADLAVATWSLEWNYGPGWDEVLLDAYGVQVDVERTAYYRLLWDLSP